MQTAAYLVGGDDVRLTVRVEPGAALELADISATLAHPGARARQLIELDVGDGARLAFAEQPLVIAAGARLERRVTIVIGAGARVVHRDTLVFGRHGEPPGHAHSRTRVARGTRPILDETVDTGDHAALRSLAVVGDAKAVATLGRYGVAGQAPDGAFALGPEDTLIRRLVASTRDLGGLDEIQRGWTASLITPMPGDSTSVAMSLPSRLDHRVRAR
ncbi:MAG: Urease accessory protein UreH-like protein [Solirubrobacterales bacterium]|nr:Urease accessory protein UreH-like protein [Solirubrobacterales bacterium]